MTCIAFVLYLLAFAVYYEERRARQDTLAYPWAVAFLYMLAFVAAGQA